MTTEQSTDIVARLATIDEKVSTIQTRLFGNGQPGDLEKQNRRIVATEGFIDRARGGMWAMGALITVLSGLETLHMLGVIK